MSAPIRNTSVVAKGLGRLTGALKNQPNIRALLAAYLQPLQDLEDAAWGVYIGFQLAQATVYQLPQTNSVFDVIGELVGLAREGLSDGDYKSLLYLQIAVNVSKGRTVDWSNFAAILLRTSTGPAAYLDGVAQFYFGVWGMTLNPNLVAAILSEAAGNGVGPNVFAYSTWADGNDFEWCDINNVSTTGQDGFGDSVAGAVGGLLVSGVQI